MHNLIIRQKTKNTFPEKSLFVIHTDMQIRKEISNQTSILLFFLGMVWWNQTSKKNAYLLLFTSYVIF